MSAGAPPSPPPAARTSRFWHPFTQVGLCILSGTASEVFLKKGATNTAALPAWGADWLGLTGLDSGWTWVSIVFTLLGFFSWMAAIRVLPLGVAFPLTNGVHIFVPLGSLVFLHEHIGLLRGSGIVIIIVGIVLLAQSVAKVEEKV